MEWVQLILAALVGLGAGNWWTRRHASREAEKQREHASTEARAMRRFEIRLEAYKDASKCLSRHERWVNFTEPIWGPAPDPPDLSPDDEWDDFGGMIAVTASDAVRDAMRAAVDAEMRFVAAVAQYRRSEGGRKVDSENPGADMHQARVDAIGAIQHAQTVMRDELADLLRHGNRLASRPPLRRFVLVVEAIVGRGREPDHRGHACGRRGRERQADGQRRRHSHLLSVVVRLFL